MSWLKIDDEFEDHPKVVGLSDGAHRLWMMAACWCRKPANSRSAAGFVPKTMLGNICRNKFKPSALAKLAAELVDANGGGMFEFGLWEAVDGGWMFHDWAAYQPENTEKEAMSRSESARVAGKRSAAVRRERTGTAQPRSPNDVPNDVRTEPRTTFDRTTPERPEPPLPLPLPLPKAAAEKRFVRDESEQPKTRIQCPPDLCLLDGQISNLEMAGAPRWAIDLLTREMVGKFVADPNTRTREAWLKTLSRAVSGEWNSGRRPKRPDPNALPPRSERTWMTAEEAGLPT